MKPNSIVRYREYESLVTGTMFHPTKGVMVQVTYIDEFGSGCAEFVSENTVHPILHNIFISLYLRWKIKRRFKQTMQNKQRGTLHTKT